MRRRRVIAALGGLLGGACSPAAPQQQMQSMPPTPTTVFESREAMATSSDDVAGPTSTPSMLARATRVDAVVTAEPTTNPTAEPVSVLPGVDVLLDGRKEVLSGRSVGLVTNATGRTRAGESSIDALNRHAEWQLKALFSPEHGIRGEAAAGESIGSATDPTTGLPIYSLYGSTTRPTESMLQGIDTLAYDIQDVGARTYTYISTLLEVMKVAAAKQIKVVVLDRPDPIGGDAVDGDVLDARFTSFVGPAPIAMRYGMTVGELAQFFNAELNVGADLSVIAMKRWQRTVWFDQTGLEWVNPSPNLRSLSAAALYPGMVLFEGTNLSEGRGTERPFEWIGAPWIDAEAWAAAISADNAQGVRFTPAEETPDSSKFAGHRCHGLSIEITDRQQLKPMELGVAMIVAARAVSSRLTFNDATFDGLAGTDQVRRAIEAGTTPKQITTTWNSQLQAFNEQRQRYLMY